MRTRLLMHMIKNVSLLYGTLQKKEEKTEQYFYRCPAHAAAIGDLERKTKFDECANGIEPHFRKPLIIRCVFFFHFLNK